MYDPHFAAIGSSDALLKWHRQQRRDVAAKLLQCPAGWPVDVCQRVFAGWIWPGLLDDIFLVVAQNRTPAVRVLLLQHQRQAFSRLRPAVHHIAGNHHCIRLPRVNVAQRRLQGGEIGVDIC